MIGAVEFQSSRWPSTPALGQQQGLGSSNLCLPRWAWGWGAGRGSASSEQSQPVSLWAKLRPKGLSKWTSPWPVPIAITLPACVGYGLRGCPPQDGSMRGHSMEAPSVQVSAPHSAGTGLVMPWVGLAPLPGAGGLMAALTFLGILWSRSWNVGTMRALGAPLTDEAPSVGRGRLGHQ